MALAPNITFPTTSPGFSTNLAQITLKGTTDISTVSILVNSSTDGVVYTSGATDWMFSTMLSEGSTTFNVVAKDGLGAYSTPDSIIVTRTSEDNLNLIVSAPTGIILDRGKNYVKTSIIQNPEPEVIGYNFYGSEDVGGGINGYTLLNTLFITEPDFYKENSIVLSETVDTSGDIRNTYTIERVTRDYYYSYTHDRVNNPLGSKPISELNNYVATAVAFDSVLLQQVESPYSAELGAAPLLLDTSIRDLPARTTLDVQESYITEIIQTDPTIDVKPGTITRDIHINPPSDEFERLYIIQDFMHRSQSFLTLLALDDANNDGVSDLVSESTYKKKLQAALLIPDVRVDEVQQLIDDAFTKLAGNVNITRKPAQKALGQVLFYTRRTPTRDATINAGSIIETISDATTPPVRFTVLTDFTLPVAELSNYYNPNTDRYEILLDIEASVEGADGNVDAGKIQLIVSGIDSIFGVYNNNPTEFGQDIESNADLARRAVLAFVSVDSGTEGGYLATTLGTPQVQRAKIISANEDLMQRDIDPLRLVHTFGKVDIYIQGSLSSTHQESFGFIYKTVKNQAALIQSVQFWHFKIVNSNIDITKPIYDVLEIKNVTKSANYDLTGFLILGDGDVINIDENLPANSAIGLDASDVILISYRFRDSDPYIFLNQPVESISSIVGDSSGTLTEANYLLQKLQDPLDLGNSTSAKDQMTLYYANGVPLGGVTDIFNEPHVLTGENLVELTYFGIDDATIVVTNSTGSITYIKDIDYQVIPGAMNILTQLGRLFNSSIVSGTTVLVSYQCGENFVVTYNVNSLLTNVQNRINVMKHLTADVVVKGAQKTFVDFDMTVVLTEGSDQTSIDRKIRTAVAGLFASKMIGVPVYQSDVINVIEEIPGVDYIVVPFNKMVRANNSMVIRELLSTGWDVYQTVTVTAYKSRQTLKWATIENGGPEASFKGVFENDIQLTSVTQASQVAEGAGRVYISADGHLYVSPKLGTITQAAITVTYVVMDATGARDIDFCEIEYGAVGTLTITYDYSKKFKGF